MPEFKKDPKRMLIVMLEDCNDDESVPEHEERETAFRAYFEVCGRCDGKGVRDHEAFSNGISMQEFDEDPEFHKAYMEGRYDVVCFLCSGARVVFELNESEAKREHPEAYKRYLEYQRDERRHLAEIAYERNMGCLLPARIPSHNLKGIT
jgi:hypothetical protein